MSRHCRRKNRRVRSRERIGFVFQTFHLVPAPRRRKHRPAMVLAGTAVRAQNVSIRQDYEPPACRSPAEQTFRRAAPARVIARAPSYSQPSSWPMGHTGNLDATGEEVMRLLELSDKGRHGDRRHPTCCARRTAMTTAHRDSRSCAGQPPMRAPDLIRFADAAAGNPLRTVLPLQP